MRYYFGGQIKGRNMMNQMKTVYFHIADKYVDYCFIMRTSLGHTKNVSFSQKTRLGENKL